MHEQLTCRPIDRWDGPRTDPRKRPTTGAPWQRIRLDLQRELDLLDASAIVLGLDVRPDQHRLDGWPKAGVNPPPPVVLTFESRHGPLRYQCDRFWGYEANVRAIGLTLWRLRLVDEGGVAHSGEQYRGWSQLGDGSATALGPGMSKDQAARIVLDAAGMDVIASHVLQAINSSDFRQTAYRQAAKDHHPDRGGDAEAFKLLTEAMAVLAA